MKYSLTMTGIIVAVAGPILVNAGFSEVCSNEIMTVVPALVGGVMAWVGRIRAGGVNVFGAKR